MIMSELEKSSFIISYQNMNNNYIKNNKFFIKSIINKKKKILFSLFLIIFLFKFFKLFLINKIMSYNELLNDNNIMRVLLIKIKEFYKKNGYVNINEIENTIPNGRVWNKNKNIKNEINIGIQLDPGYVLRVMMTIASIMDSQKNTTKIRFHFAVVLSFNESNMLKIYSLRRKIRDDVEFNFYNAQKVEIDFKDMNTKGPGAVAKLLLPDLLPNEIDKLIVFDTGDLLVLRDLSEMYNWNMKNYLYVGVPALGIGKYATISKKKFDIYINVGNFIINVTKVKKEKMYEKFIKYKNIYKSAVADQHLLNDIAFGKIGYIPLKFGLRSPYKNDKESENPPLINGYSFVNRIKFKNIFPFIPKNESQLFKEGYSPVVIHHCNIKWMYGKGMTIYRRLAQYYIRLAGIWDELCNKFPGYCIK